MKIEPTLRPLEEAVQAPARTAESGKEGRGWDRAVKRIIIGTGSAFLVGVVAVTVR